MRKRGARELQRIGREQALSFTRQHEDHARAVATTPAAVIAAIRNPRLGPAFQVGDETFNLSTALLLSHMLAVGGTGSGKTTLVYGLLVTLTAAMVENAVDAATRDDDERGLGLELLVLDPKGGELVQLKALFAALYLASRPDVQRILRGAFRSIEWSRTRVTAKPLIERRDAVSHEYQAELITEIIVVTGPSDWTDGTRFLLFQVNRLLLYKELPFDAVTIRVILTNESFRLSLLAGLPVDLADYFGRLSQHVPAPTMAAFVRRILMLLAIPEIRATLSLPLSALRRRHRRPSIVLADCGPGSALPPTIASAQAHAIIVDDTLQTPTRDPRVPKVRVFDEFAKTMRPSPVLLERYIDQQRTDRSAGVASWALSQSMDAIPAAALEEILTNTGWMVALQSRDRYANLLFPHYVSDRPVHGTDAERRMAFARELASLQRQEAVLWVKTAGALRVRAVDVADPTRTTGRSLEELGQIFDEILAPGSTIAVSEADELLTRWRGEHLPQDDPPRTRAAGTNAPSPRGLLGLDEEGER
jgi:hypothetical protein